MSRIAAPRSAALPAPGTPPVPRRPRSAAGARARAEVLRRDLVEELAELLDLVLLLVGDLDPDLVEQVLGTEDGRTGPDGEGDGVRGAGADHAVLPQHQLGDVDAI